MAHKERNWSKWIILAAGFCINVFVFAAPFCFGSLLTAMMDKFQENIARTATVQAIFIGFSLTAGTLTGMLISRFGMRKISLAGGVMASLGFILSFMATSIVHLYICIGTIAGIGTSIVAISATTAVGHSFSGSQRLLALSIQNTGMSVGGALIPYLYDYLVKMYGLNGNFLVMGGVYLNCLPIAMLFSMPYEARKKKNSKRPTSIENVETRTHTDRKSQNCLSTFCTEFKQLKADMHKVIRPPFILTTLGVGFSNASLDGFKAIILDILNWKGLSHDESLRAFPIISGCGFVGRLLPGIAKQFKGVSCFLCLVIFSLFGVCGQLLFLLHSSSLPLQIGCGFTGLSIAGVISGANTVVATILNKDHISIGIGLMYSTLGILEIIYGPVYGAVKDATLSYTAVFYSTLAFQLLGIALFLAAIFTRGPESKGTSGTLEGQENHTLNIEE